MRYLEIAGQRLSLIGLGCWQFGSPDWGYGREFDEATARAVVERALELGINLFDTAEIYGQGESERILGRALVGRREGAFVASKVLPIVPTAGRVVSRARRSLRRLGMERLDLYQVHWPNPLARESWLMAGMRRLLEERLVRHAGVSNYGLAGWQAAEAALGRPVLSNQVHYSLLERAPERELLPWAETHGRLILAYSPLEQGLLSGKYDGRTHPGGARRTNPRFTRENLRRARPVLDALREVGRRHGATPAQAALAWLVHRPNVVAIPGAKSPRQLEENAAAADLGLSDEDLARLDEVSAAYRPRGLLASLPAMTLGR